MDMKTWKAFQGQSSEANEAGSPFVRWELCESDISVIRGILMTRATNIQYASGKN